MLTLILLVAFALIVYTALTFIGRGFLGWVAGVGVLLLGWRLTGVSSPLLFESAILYLSSAAESTVILSSTIAVVNIFFIIKYVRYFCQIYGKSQIEKMQQMKLKRKQT